MGRILHWLDGLTSVIWAIYYSHPTRAGYPTTSSGTRKTGYPCACKWLLLWRLWPPTLDEKNSKSCHILHPWQNWIPTLPELVTQPQVPPPVLAHAKLATRVSVSGYLCDVYGHPLFMKKIQNSFLIRVIYYTG